MRKTFLSCLRDQRGVAMVTVMLVGAVLSAVATVAAFSTVQELRASGDDRRGSAALAYAEAGIERMVEYIRSGKVTWNDIRLAGCFDGTRTRPPLQLPSGSLGGAVGDGSGSFIVELSVFRYSTDATLRLPPGSCPADPDTTSIPRGTFYFAITSRGTHPAATRVIRQVVGIGALGLPVGIFAQNVHVHGTPSMSSISVVTPNDVFGREKMGFTGTDPYYRLKDFWPQLAGSSDGELSIPAAVHSMGSLYLKDQAQNGAEHPNAKGNPTTLNCSATNRGTPGQSMWDQSGPDIGGEIPLGTPACSNWTGTPAGPPPSSELEDLEPVTPRPELSDQDYLTLRNTAMQDGLYCKVATDNTKTCTKMGAAWIPGGNNANAAQITVDHAAVNDPTTGVLARHKTFVAYFEYENGSSTTQIEQNVIKWDAAVGPCSSDPEQNRSVVAVVRNGSFRVESGVTVNGAFFVPEGTMTTTGGATINGTIIAKNFDNRGGANFSLDSGGEDCWLQNMPGPFLSVNPAAWSEIDR